MNIWKIKQPYPNTFGNLKNNGLSPEIQWIILKKSNTPNCFHRRSNLYLEENIQIMLYPDPNKSFNQRSDLIGRCNDRNKFKL